LFAEYSVRLAVIIIDIVVLGDTAYDFGWHEFTLKPKNGGETVRKRLRYLEVWEKNSSGNWKLSLIINNADVREELAGCVSHWFLSEEQAGNLSSSTRS
jgi:ketosteroid isomerase-like protein